MSFKVQAFTLAPSILLLTASVYLSVLALQAFEELPSELGLLVFAACFFFAGVALAICWIAYWGLYKVIKKQAE